MPDEQDLQAKRRAAQLAMEGDFWQKKRQEKEELINKRRLDAQKAMESPERKQRRRDEELAAKRVADAAVKAEAAKQAATEAEANKAKSLAADAARQAAERETRFGKIAAGEKQVAQMAQAPLRAPSTLGTVRTLKTDLAQAAQKEQVSLTQIAIKEQEKRRIDLTTIANEPPKRGHGVLVFLVFLMIMVGLGALGYAWWLKNGNPFVTPPATTTNPTVPKSLIFSDRQTVIDVPSSTSATDLRTKVLEVVVAVDRPSATIEQIIFTKNGKTANFSTWQSDLKLDLPPSLLETLGRESMLGAYYPTTGERGLPFLVVTAPNYEKTFNTLRQEELRLTQPLALIAITQAPIISASSTAPTPVWSSRAIYNTDVRVWPTPDTTAGLFYTFLDRSTIAFAPNQATLIELITRFRTAN